MIMCVVPNNKGDSYHAIKKVLCVDKPIPSQVRLLLELCWIDIARFSLSSIA